MDIEELIGNLHELLSLAEDGLLYRQRKEKADAQDVYASPGVENNAPSGGRRRRASSPTVASNAADQTASETTTAVTVRRRRGQSGANPTPPAQVAPTVETSARTTRRHASVADTSSDDKITDADLLKAASAAAQKITPDGVKEIVRQFARNGQLNDIPADNRRDFLRDLKAKVALA